MIYKDRKAVKGANHSKKAKLKAQWKRHSQRSLKYSTMSIKEGSVKILVLILSGMKI
jgi:hypothetical protein